MDCKIVDTTLRDGEQKSGLSYSLSQKLEIAKCLEQLSVYQIEAGTPAMGGEEKESIFRIKQLGLACKISAWNRLNIKDLRHSMDCGVDLIHIAVPTSEIHIRRKLSKDTEWVMENLQKCIDYCKNHDYQVSIGFEDASRGDRDFIKSLCAICENEGVERIRIADTVGILTPHRTYKLIQDIRNSFNLEIEIHAHNDFGMAVANSLAAYKAGAEYVDCTLGGLGERAGNCDFKQFSEAYGRLLFLKNRDS